MLTPFERGLIAHLVGDWLLQNDWMATNKGRLTHPAAWVHGAILGALLALALGWEAGLLLGAVHILVDTRVLLRWWQRAFGQTADGPKAVLVSVGVDQVLHIASMAAWVAIVYR
jgi:hypothetical protein